MYGTSDGGNEPPVSVGGSETKLSRSAAAFKKKQLTVGGPTERKCLWQNLAV